MARSEQQFIQLVKRQIEEKFSFESSRGTQRDLEMLSSNIEEKTGVSISLSTLKRLWRDNFKQSPQLATLNALSAILDHKDWRSFKQANAQVAPRGNKKLVLVAAAVVSFIVIGLLVSYSIRPRTKTGRALQINGPVRFEASKTVSSGIPNTVIFKYDVSNVVADYFYIQQSWNDDHRMAIAANGNTITSIYYESGFHRARLIANDSVLAMQPVHILSKGWESHIYSNDSDPELIDLQNEKFIVDGKFHLDSAVLVKRNLDYAKRFHTRITNSQVFDVHSDNFTFTTRMKADPVSPQLCGWMDLFIVTDVQTFGVSWTEKGCEKYASYKLGEIEKKGEDNDLSALGSDIYSWQELEIQVRNRNATILLNGNAVFTEVYKQDFGKIVALIYIFDGTGSIDYARLMNRDGEIVFADEF
jgi:hypothetical protein